MNNPTPTQPRAPADKSLRPKQNELGHPARIRSDRANALLICQLAAAVDAGDRDQILLLAPQIVAAAAQQKTNQIEDHLLSIQEVARRLDVSVRSITRFLAQQNGDFPRPSYVGALRKWEPADIERYKALRRMKRS